MLNIVWPIFIIISFSYSIFFGDINLLNSEIFRSIENAINLSINLLGTVCLWNGIMQIASKTSVIDKLTRFLKPIIKCLFPELRNKPKIQKEISMNMIANILGLGNAATPLGLKAMKSMQEENPEKERLTEETDEFGYTFEEFKQRYNIPIKEYLDMDKLERGRK